MKTKVILLLIIFSLITISIANNLQDPPTIFSRNILVNTYNSAKVMAIIGTSGSDTYAWFEWGTDTTFGNITSVDSLGNGPGAYGTIQYFSNLSPLTTYYYRAVAQNTNGITYSSYDCFSTHSDNYGSIYTVTLPADSITTTSAYLRARVMPNGNDVEVWFGYDEIPNLGFIPRTPSIFVSRDSTEVEVSCKIDGLPPNTNIYFRARSKSTANSYVFGYGEIQCAKTLFDSINGGIIIPFRMKDNFPRKSIEIYFGVHTHATECVDFWLKEIQVPPLPPSNVIDFRFVHQRPNLAQCYDQGLWADIQPYTHSTQIDTYKVRFQTNYYPVTFSWGNLANFYSGQVVLKGHNIFVDMKTDTSYVCDDTDINILYIIAEYPMVTLLTPNLFLNKATDISHNSAKISCMIAPNGLETITWFEWGSNSLYENSKIPSLINNQAGYYVINSELDHLMNNTIYHYRVAVQNSNGIFYSQGETFITTGASCINDNSIPEKIYLFQNYPNPFNSSTIIKYQIAEKCFVKIKVYNILGREVATLVDEFQDLGQKTVEFNASNFASGVYTYKLKVINISDPGKTYIKVKKMLLLR